MLLEPNISLGQTIEIESSAIPACNGQYWIYEFTHRGHLRGTEFYTEISARRNSHRESHAEYARRER